MEVLEVLEEVQRKPFDVGGAEQSDVEFSERRIHLKVKRSGDFFSVLFLGLISLYISCGRARTAVPRSFVVFRIGHSCPGFYWKVAA